MFLRLVTFLAILCSLCSPDWAQSANLKLNGLEQRKGQMVLAAQADVSNRVTRRHGHIGSNAKGFTNRAGCGWCATQANIQAEHALTAAQQRVTQLQNQMADWETSTLKVHGVDGSKFKVDWGHGEIVPK